MVGRRAMAGEASASWGGCSGQAEVAAPSPLSWGSHRETVEAEAAAS
jgi:hypothetical protein